MEDCRCVMKSEIDHIKTDILDIRATAKEQSKDMLSMRDSHTETKIYIRQIQDSQAVMAKETKDSLSLMARETKESLGVMAKESKESQAAQAKETKDNQIAMMKVITEIKDEPIRNFKYYKMVGWAFAITYVLGTIFGIVKTVAPQLVK